MLAVKLPYTEKSLVLKVVDNTFDCAVVKNCSTPLSQQYPEKVFSQLHCAWPTPWHIQLICKNWIDDEEDKPLVHTDHTTVSEEDDKPMVNRESASISRVPTPSRRRKGPPIWRDPSATLEQDVSGTPR